jgi:peptidoglycan-associated lipoprotein
MNEVLSKTRRPGGQHRRRLRNDRLLTVALAVALSASCVRPTLPPSRPPEPVRPPAPAEEPPAAPADVRRPTPPVPPATPLPEDDFASQSLEEINRNSPLQPVFFDYNNTDLDANARAAIEANASLLAWYANWSVTVEGHCDSRGTPEYNLALGEQRALAVRRVLVNLGVEASRIRTISYGEEFPFAPGDRPEAWAQNRRAHFVVTAR